MNSNGATRTARSVLTTGNFTEFGYEDIDEAFPPVKAPVRPFGDYGLFQIRQPKSVTKGGLLIVEEARSTEHYNTQVAKVISLGPLCFKTQVTHDVIDPITALHEQRLELLTWPEGPWFDVGEFVRVPRYSGDRLTATFERTYHIGKEKETVKEEVIFVLFRVKSILAVENDPLAAKAYLD